MAVSSTVNRASYDCDGSQQTFPFSFAIQEEDDLIVTLVDADGNETVLVRGSGADYVLQAALNDFSNGGNVITDLAYASGNTLVLYREVPLTQEVDYEEGDAFPAEVHEAAIDKLTFIAQQLNEKIGRNLTVPIVDEQPGQIPNAATRASKFLAFDTSGDPIAAEGMASVPVSTAMTPLVQAVSIDAANALLGRGWEEVEFPWFRDQLPSDTYRKWKKGLPMGLFDDTYVMPYQFYRTEVQTAATLPGKSSYGSLHRIVYMYKSSGSYNHLWLYLMRTSGGDLEAWVLSLADDGTWTVVSGKAAAGISNVASQTGFLARCSDTLYGMAYKSSTGTLRCIALTWNEGTTTLAFAGDMEVASATNHNKVKGLEVGRWSNSKFNDNMFSILVNYTSGTGGIRHYSMTWGGSSWTKSVDEQAAAPGGGDVLVEFEPAKEPLQAMDEYDIWMMNYYDPQAGFEAIYTVSFYLDSSGVIYRNSGHASVRMWVGDEDPTMICFAKVGEDTDATWASLVCLVATPGTLDRWVTESRIIHWDHYDWNVWQGPIEICHEGFQMAGQSNEQYSPVNLNRLTPELYARLTFIYRLLDGKLVYLGEENPTSYVLFGNYKGWIVGQPENSSYRYMVPQRYVGVAAEDPPSNGQNMKVRRFGYLGGLSGLGSWKDRELRYHFIEDYRPYDTRYYPLRYYYQSAQGRKIGRALSDTEMIVGV